MNPNVGFVCDKHKPQPNDVLARQARKNPESFVGKHVKMGFTAPALGPEGKEHMWVLVESYGMEGKKSKKRLVFHGRLANDPQFIPNLTCGVGVSFTADEIEQLMA